MLVPLETLPGWPAVETPSVLEILGLLVGIPALLAVLIAGLVKLGAMLEAKRHPQSDVPESVWLNGPAVNGPTPEELRPIDGRIEDAGEVPARTPEEAAADSPGRMLPDEQSEGRRGGASARW